MLTNFSSWILEPFGRCMMVSTVVEGKSICPIFWSNVPPIFSLFLLLKLIYIVEPFKWARCDKNTAEHIYKATLSNILSQALGNKRKCRTFHSNIESNWSSYIIKNQPYYYCQYHLQKLLLGRWDSFIPNLSSHNAIQPTQPQLLTKYLD